MDCRREHVPVVTIRQRQLLNQMLVSGDQGVADMRFHEGANPGEAFTRQIGSGLQQRRDPLFVHTARPARTEEVGQGQMHEYVVQQRRIQRADIEEGDERNSPAHARPSSWSSTASSRSASRRFARVAAL